MTLQHAVPQPDLTEHKAPDEGRGKQEVWTDFCFLEGGMTEKLSKFKWNT